MRLLDKIARRLGYVPMARFESMLDHTFQYRIDSWRFETRWLTACAAANKERAWRKNLQRINGELAMEAFRAKQP